MAGDKPEESKEESPADAEVRRKATKKALIEKVTAANAELMDKYLQEGPFVYELYAIMIHQGGAHGGHYFAYIKDIETGKWYNFNDSIVREISIIDLVESFGPEAVVTHGPGKRTNMAAKRLAHSRSTSAYMLMYRLVDKTEDRANLSVHEDEIPGEVKEDVAQTEVADQQVRVERQERSQRMQLKVVYRPKDSVLAADIDMELTQRVYYVDRATDTYSTFFDTVYKDVIGD